MSLSISVVPTLFQAWKLSDSDEYAYRIPNPYATLVP